MTRKGVSNAIAAALLVAGMVIGVVGYYVATTYQTKTVTETEITTSIVPTTLTHTVVTITTQLRTIATTVTAGCPPPPPSTNGSVYACVNTSQGSFEIELFATLTPKTVANFVNLSRSGFYNDLVWHRIVPGFVIQTGDNNTRGPVDSTRSTWGQGGSRISVAFEYAPSLHNYVGYLGMASTAAKAGGTSQFYINLVNNSVSLDQKYAVFGRVISGLQVVNAIASVQTYCEPGGSIPAGCQSGGYPEQPVVASQATLLSIVMLGR